jgi:two-component system, LuxR family, response regulator FixJ
MPMSDRAPVFVVDDDAAVREGLKALLAAKGYKVETFANAEAFLAVLPPYPAGCLVLDVRMPGMSGLELQGELKRRGITLPIIMMTGHGDIQMAVAALKAGAVDFLEKPFDAEALAAGISEALRHPLGPLVEARFDTRELALRSDQLTPREREVMDLVAAGLPNKVIAARLRIALRTVEIHRARVMEKMGARHLSELVRMVIRLQGGD